MGIRFACHVCAKQLNIKEELAGKRGICPACSSKFRIPKQNAERSLAIEDPPKAAVSSKAPVSKKSAVSAKPAVKPDVEIDLISSAPDATWYVRPPSGGQYGPADGDVLRSWIGGGRVAATALLWRDGWPNWRSASEVLPGLSDRSPKKDSASATTPAPPQATQQPVPEPVFAESKSGPVSGTDHAKSLTIAETPDLSGRSDVGTTRRQKNGKRIFWIGTLLAIAIALIVVLVYLVSGSS